MPATWPGEATGQVAMSFCAAGTRKRRRRGEEGMMRSFDGLVEFKVLGKRLSISSWALEEKSGMEMKM